MPKLIRELLNPKPAPDAPQTPPEQPRLSLRKLILDILDAHPEHAFRAVEIAVNVSNRLEKLIDRRDPRRTHGWTATLFEETRDQGESLLRLEDSVLNAMAPLVQQSVVIEHTNEDDREVYFYVPPNRPPFVTVTEVSS